MINAAEPVDYMVIHQFYQTFSPFGLRDGVVVPTYGLAEHTVFVCSGGRTMLCVDKNKLVEESKVHVLYREELGESDGKGGAAHTHAFDKNHMMRIVGCGFPANHDVQVVIASVSVEDPTTSATSSTPGATIIALPDLEVGEVWVDSPSKAQGYWQQPALNEHDFQASLYDPDAKDDGRYDFLLFLCNLQFTFLPIY